ncbi:MAG: permease, partial [Rubrobacteraceae bacterium]
MSRLRAASFSVRQIPVLSDRIVLFTAVILIFLSVFVPDQAPESFWFTLRSLWGIAGFLLVSVLFAAYAKASAADQLVANVFAAGGNAVVVVAASGFGVLSPFCSCGVVPIVAALLAAGAPLPAVMAFWMSSPLMDPEMFLLTAGNLGMDFALARLVSAFGMGLLAGYATWALQRRDLFENPLKRYSSCATSSVGDPDELIWAFWRDSKRRATFVRELRKTGFFLTKWLTL